MLDTQWFIQWVTRSHALIHEHREELTELDRQIGDADHGENMCRGYDAALQALHEQEPTSPAEVCKTLAKIMISTVGGASGPLYGTAFLRMSKAATEPIDAPTFLACIKAGLTGIQDRGKATTGEKTMVDAWSTAIEYGEEELAKNSDLPALISALTRGAQAGAQASIAMHATKGRASYLGERSQGVMDPGCASTAYIFEAMENAQ